MGLTELRTSYAPHTYRLVREHFGQLSVLGVLQDGKFAEDTHTQILIWHLVILPTLL